MLEEPDRTTAEQLQRARLPESLVDQVLRPFLSGVFLGADLMTSARFFRLVLRSVTGSTSRATTRTPRPSRAPPVSGRRAASAVLAAHLSARHHTS